MSESLLRIAEVIRRTGLSRSGIYAGMMAGTFPRALKRRSTPLWLESEVQAFIDREAQTLPRMGSSMGARRQVVRKRLKDAVSGA